MVGQNTAKLIMRNTYEKQHCDILCGHQLGCEQILYTDSIWFKPVLVSRSLNEFRPSYLSHGAEQSGSSIVSHHEILKLFKMQPSLVS